MKSCLVLLRALIPVVIFTGCAVLNTSNTNNSLVQTPNSISRTDIENKRVAPMNGHQVSNRGKEYFFYAVGHLYGNYDHKLSAMSSSSLLANLNMINNSGAAFFMAMGDNFRLFKEPYISCYKYGWVNQLEIPFFNAVGNHDVDFGEENYSYHFGPTYYSFIKNSEMFIVLNTGRQNHPYMPASQIEYVCSKLQEAKANPNIKNVFMFTHKLIWAERGYDYFKTVHQKTNISNTNNYFRSQIYPVMLELAETPGKKVYIGSGDVGYHSPPVFYHKNPNDKITYFAAGINDDGKDAMLKISINKNGDVSFIPVSLTGQEVMPIEAYNKEYWNSYKVIH